jgi:hypothetical protein
MIRPNALIFHADPGQTLIPVREQPITYNGPSVVQPARNGPSARNGSALTFFSSGDLGDIIAALPIIKQMGGGVLCIGPSHSHNGGREPMTWNRFESMQSLLKTQSYIKSVWFLSQFDRSKIDYDLSTFRSAPHTKHDNLSIWQGRHIGIDRLNLSDPWLEVEAPSHDRVVVSRSPRYHNVFFPWIKIINRYGSKVLFVGTASEHADFQHLVRREIEHKSTKDILELAKVIKGASLQFSNQSLPFWLAAGLGKTVWQETWWTEPNSVIERDSLNYTRNPNELAELSEFLLKF